MVVILYMAQDMVMHGYPPILAVPVRIMLQWHIGVSVFFVLSGFLITTRYADKIEPTWKWAGRYMQNRFARIYPIYFLLTVISFAVMLWHPLQEWYESPATFSVTDKFNTILLNLTLLRAYFEQLATVGLPTAWSLTVEETFYVSAPFMLLGLKKDMRRLVLYPVLLFALGLLLIAVCSRWIPAYGLMANVRFLLNFTFFGRATEFVAGMGLAFWVARQPHTMSNGSRFTVLGVGGLVSFMACVTVAHHLYQVVSTAQWPWLQIAANVLVLPFIVCVLFWGLLSENTWLRRLLETPLFDLLGKSSYVLYLIHLGTFDTLFQQHVSDNNAVRLIAYILVSIALYKLIEHPLHKRLRAKPTRLQVVA